MITFCPNCTEKLTDNAKLAQGVKECIACGGRFHILETRVGENQIFTPADTPRGEVFKDVIIKHAGSGLSALEKLKSKRN